MCGSGIGMSIAANRHKGIRAALVHDGEEAALARKHNDANVLCLGARTTSEDKAKEALKTFSIRRLKAEGMRSEWRSWVIMTAPKRKFTPIQTTDNMNQAEVQLPSGTIGIRILRIILSAHPEATPQQRLTFPPNTIIADTKLSLDALGPAAIARFDFSGLNLTYARLGRVPIWQEFKYDENTLFPM